MSIFVLTLNALTAIGEAGIYSASQVKDYRVMPETTTHLRSDDYEFGMQTNSGSQVNHYWLLLWTYSGSCVDQYGSPH